MLGRLDAFGDGRLVTALGELLERAQHCLRGIVLDAGLDQREIDLHDVELELAEQPQAGVAGSHVIGRDPHPLPTEHGKRRPQPVQVLDGLALGQLQDDPGRVDPATAGEGQELLGREGIGLE